MLRWSVMVWMWVCSGCSVEEAAEEESWTPKGCRGERWQFPQGCEGAACIEDEQARVHAAAFLEEAAATEWGPYLVVRDAIFAEDPNYLTIDVIAQLDWYVGVNSLIVDLRFGTDAADAVQRATTKFIYDLGPIPQLAHPDDVLAAGRTCHGDFDFAPCGGLGKGYYSVDWLQTEGGCGDTVSSALVDAVDLEVKVCRVDDEIECETTGD